jgi:hypothetical protein
MKNEKTGERAGGFAAVFLANSKGVPKTDRVIAVNANVKLGLMRFLVTIGKGKGIVTDLGSVAELQSAVASALTQRPDGTKKTRIP